MPCPIRSSQGVKPAPPCSIYHFSCVYLIHPVPFACPPPSTLRPTPFPCLPASREKNVEKQSSASGGAPHQPVAPPSPKKTPRPSQASHHRGETRVLDPPASKRDRPEDPPLPNTNKPVIVSLTGATGHPAVIPHGAPSLPTKYHALSRSSRPSPQRGGTTWCKPTTSAPGEYPPFRPDRTRL